MTSSVQSSSMVSLPSLMHVQTADVEESKDVDIDLALGLDSGKGSDHVVMNEQ